jgi:glycosyltransferase involved in cell wall biosynthesis
MNRMRITLYVPCYNAAAHLARVLEGVFAQTLPADEVIVVDDGSRDGSAEIAARFPVTLIRHEQNRGLSAARNTAMRAARCELVAALDSDAVPDREWLSRLAPHFENEKVALGGGKLLEAVQHTVADRWRAAHLPLHCGDVPLENPYTVYGANTIARRSAVLEAGGYDERMRTDGDDGYISGLLRSRGWTTFYDPTAVCHHLAEDTVRTALETFWRYRRDFLEPMTPTTAAKILRLSRLGILRAAGCGLRDLRAGRYRLLGMDVLLLPFVFLSYAGLRRSESRAPDGRPAAASPTFGKSSVA